MMSAVVSCINKGLDFRMEDVPCNPVTKCSFTHDSTQWRGEDLSHFLKKKQV